MSFPEDLAQKATRSLVKLGVTVMCSAMVRDINKEALIIENEENLDYIRASTVIWAGGNTASSLGQALAYRTQANTDKVGRVTIICGKGRSFTGRPPNKSVFTNTTAGPQIPSACDKRSFGSPARQRNILPCIEV
jgi:hypothetical protein